MNNDEDHFRAVREEVARHLEDADTSKLAHWAAAQRYENIHRFWLGLPSTVLAIALAWLLSSQTKGALTTDGFWGRLLAGLPVFISLIVSLLSGMTAFLDLNGLAIRHRTAAENLNALSRSCRNWNTDFPDSFNCAEAVKAVQRYRARLNEINCDAPQIPKWAWKTTRKQREEGSISYETDNPPQKKRRFLSRLRV